MPKKTAALARIATAVISGPLATAAAQIATLQKVLISYASWRKVTVLTPANLAEAKATLVAVREVADTAEKGRKALTKPILDEKKAIDEAYKPIAEVCAGYDGHLTRLLLAFDEAERVKLVKAAEKTAKALEKKGAEQAAADVRTQALEAAPVDGGGVTTQEVWRAEVEDLHDLAAAALERPGMGDLILPNMTRLNTMARESKGQNPPPGVKFVCEKIVKRS